ncbi:MAG: hypothetical protein AAF995_04490 [Planctomycetota bacterium]
MDFADIFYEVVRNEETLLIFAISTSIVVAILIKSIAGVFKINARERTKREIAAYIAEGSMTPEQGERLLRSGSRGSGC